MTPPQPPMPSVLEMKEKEMTERFESPTFQKMQRSKRTQVAEDTLSQKTISGLNKKVPECMKM